jgi:hypothetical protein
VPPASRNCQASDLTNTHSTFGTCLSGNHVVGNGAVRADEVIELFVAGACPHAGQENDSHGSPPAPRGRRPNRRRTDVSPIRQELNGGRLSYARLLLILLVSMRGEPQLRARR